MSEGPTLVSNLTNDQNPSSTSNNNQARPSSRRNRAPQRPRQGGEGQTGSQNRREHRQEPNQGDRRPRNGGGGGPWGAPRAEGSSRPRRGGNANSTSAVEAVSEQTAQLAIHASSSSSSGPSRPAKQQRSRKQFGSQLTSATPNISTRDSGHHNGANAKIPVTSLGDLDLTSRLIYSFTHKDDALDCPICFNSIHPAQPIWSCSLSSEVGTCCWGTFHLKCIRSWATKSTSVLCAMTSFELIIIIIFIKVPRKLARHTRQEMRIVKANGGVLAVGRCVMKFLMSTRTFGLFRVQPFDVV